MSKQKKKFGDVIKDNLQKITIILFSIIYIAQGLFTVIKKDTTIWDIVGSVGMAIVIGVIISSSMNSMGLKDGRKSEKFVNSMQMYGETKSKATPYFDKLASWCEYKNAQELEQKKKEIIQSAGLNWKAYKVGFYNEHKERLDEKQLKSLQDADRCKILKINSRELLSDLPNNYGKVVANGNKFGETEHDYKTKNMIGDFISKFAMAVICGLYTLTPLINADNVQQVLASVLWNVMQIGMWLTFGIMKYVNARSFIEEEYRQTHIIQKTEYLNEFIVTMENNPNIINEYDEDAEIDKYLDELLKEKEEKKLEQQQEKELITNERGTKETEIDTRTRSIPN